MPDPVGETGPTAVCLGEAMIMFAGDAGGPLEDVESFRRSVGGAECNVAGGLAALGIATSWISRLGDDGFGRHVLRDLQKRGVDVGGVESGGAGAVDPGGQVAAQVGDVDLRPGEAVADEGSGALARLHQPGDLEVPVGPQDGVGVDAVALGHLAGGRQPVARHQPPGADRLPDLLDELRVHGGAGAPVDPESDHLRHSTSQLVE